MGLTEPTVPTTRRELLADGWTPAGLRHAVATGVLARPRSGVLAPPDSAGTSVHERLVAQARAARRSCPRATISHSAAAFLLGLDVLTSPGSACLTVPAGTALRDLADVHLHRSTLRADDLVSVAGEQTTSPARTVLDVAREHGVAAGLVVADSALRLGSTHHSELTDALQICQRWPGIRRARAAVRFADGTAESALESLSRLCIRLHRLPPPAAQQAIVDEDSHFIGRVDFLWKDAAVVGEADGLGKYTDRAHLVAEKRRQERLEQAGLTVVRWEWRDLYDFDDVARRIRRALDEPPRRRRWHIAG